VLGGSSRSTLEVRVDGVAWREVESLSDAGPHDPVFALRHGEDGATDVLFGDGVTGTRLPTGTENVVAVYRKGIGLAGLAAPGELTLLTTRPAGVRAVTNPVAAAGAADPDGVEDARRTAPLVARTLDRVVSLRDYEDVARARPGVAKVQATLAWRAGRRAVLLTVAGARGARFDETGLDATGLRAAIAAVADPAVPVDVRSFTPVFFQVAATVRVAAGHDAVTVLTAATVRLRDAFAFERREFGQPVAASQVVAVLQATAGVVAVDLDRFHRADQASPELADRLPARLARRAGPATVGAELLLLDPRPPELGVQP
jgi:predicted phage baseplate assembly protein